MDENFIRVINATYKLLDYFPDNDPLKGKAKERTLKILENLSLVSDASGWTSLKKEKASAELLDDIEVLKNYLHLGKYQGWVGGINLLILLKEYDNIKRSSIIPTNGNIKYNLEIISNVKSPEEKAIRGVENNNLKNGGSYEKQVVLPENISGSKMSERQKKILEIIANKGSAQVSDIIKEIPNITKRTIRRDIDELLKGSKIIRNGEWNKVFYQVNPNKSNDGGIAPGTQYLTV